MEVYSSYRKNLISTIDGVSLSGTASKSTKNSKNYSNSNSKSESTSIEENNKIQSFKTINNKLEVQTKKTTLLLSTKQSNFKKKFIFFKLNIKLNIDKTLTIY